MAESSFFNFYRAADQHRRHDKNPLWFVRLLQAMLALLGMTLLTDMAVVLFVPDGLNLLKETYYTEVRYLIEELDPLAAERITRWSQTAYHWTFVKTGLESFLYNFGSGDGVINSLVKGFWPVFQGAIIGFQIFVIRVSVIVLMLPFLVLAMLVGASDGYLEWFRRRTGGARESAFIYHRSKHMLNWSLIGFWFLYLIPPFAVNPAYIFIPSALILGLFSRLSIQFFKKYI